MSLMNLESRQLNINQQKINDNKILLKIMQDKSEVIFILLVSNLTRNHTLRFATSHKQVERTVSTCKQRRKVHKKRKEKTAYR